MKTTQKTITIAVAGNPNSGKTTLFNSLTGATQKVGNYPGVTVEKKEGNREVGDWNLHFVDLPGTYSLTTFSLDEVVARDYILEEKPDLILDVIDSSNLERNLYLALQLAEIGKPMVVALNMTDIARSRGIKIDPNALSKRLGVPVIETVGHKKASANELLNLLVWVANGDTPAKPHAQPYGDDVDPGVNEVAGLLKQDSVLKMNGLSRWTAMKLLEKDPKASLLVSQAGSEKARIQDTVKSICNKAEMELDEDMATLIAEGRYACASGIVSDTATSDGRHETFSDKIDKLACHRVLGPIMVCLVVFATFSLTFNLADGWAFIPWVDGMQTPCGVFGWVFEVLLPGIFAGMAEGPLKSLILDGIIGGVGGVIGFVPIIFFMFLLLAVIED